MIVYIVSLVPYHDPGDIAGVYSDREEAFAAALELYEGGAAYCVTVTEADVDGARVIETVVGTHG